MSYEVSVVANYHKGEAFPFQLLIFLFTHNYLNTLSIQFRNLLCIYTRYFTLSQIRFVEVMMVVIVCV